MSVFKGKTIIVNTEDIQHFEKHWFQSDERTDDNLRGYTIVTRHSRWDMEADNWANTIYVTKEEGEELIEAWEKSRKIDIRVRERERVLKCVSLKICPVCGSRLEYHRNHQYVRDQFEHYCTSSDCDFKINKTEL